MVCFCLLIGVFGSSAVSAAASRARALALRGRDDWRAAGIVAFHLFSELLRLWGIAARVIALPHLRVLSLQKASYSRPRRPRNRCARGPKVRIGSRTRPRARATACSADRKLLRLSCCCDRHWHEFRYEASCHSRSTRARAAPLITGSTSTNPHEATKSCQLRLKSCSPGRGKKTGVGSQLQSLILEAAREQGALIS